MPKHSLAFILIALVLLLCSDKNAEARSVAVANEEKPQGIQTLQGFHQSSAIHEPVFRVSKHDQLILPYPNVNEINPSTQETKSTALDTSTDKLWCIAKPSTDFDQLQHNINFVCVESKQAVDCGPTQPGGSCYTPGNKVSEASFVMNLYYQSLSHSPGDCFFNNSSLLISQDPSWGTCAYPASSKTA